MEPTKPDPTPSNDPYQDPLIGAITDLTTSNRQNQQTNLDLVNAVRRESDLRTEKIHSIERTNNRIDKLIKFLIAGIVALLLLAGLNVYNTTIASRAAATTQQTNELLLSCLTPGTECSNQNAQQQETILNQVRQTQLVIAVCQRQNPLPPDATQTEANASTQKIVACVKTYYPNFELPQKTG